MQSKPEPRQKVWWRAMLGLCALSAALSAAIGCATWNPYNQKKWAEQEKKYGPSFPTRQEQMRALAVEIPSMPPDQQKKKADELTIQLRAESNALMRAEITQVLGVIPGPESLSGLKIAVKDADSHVRMAACKGLGLHGSAEAAAVLAQTLGSDSDLDVQLAATRALGETQGPQAIAGLGLALEDGNPALQYRAMQSMKNVSEEDFGNDVTKWREFARRTTPVDGETAIAAQPSASGTFR
ncbi:HEAT repeat domain-containing protein [Lignipirellula cremea]|uniref:HEAT repeat protein n=1 Tax=Lignipirellula cremea TaxID=2528010 RepID=A0A518E1H6_9BACT|nr:HEAT repeat domain-containing protein [Lignipirellula cremea]QDU97948.1 hypothetical protein Pla8534_58070 [Lignipirellula cremea]